MSVSVVPVDPFNQKLGLIFPFLVRRVSAEASEDEINARDLLARVVEGSPDVLLLAMVEQDGNVIGHALALRDAQTAYILQCRADGNVGDAVDRTIAFIRKWAESSNNPELSRKVIVTTRNEAAWKKRGFKTRRYLMEMNGAPTTGDAGAGGDGREHS